MIGRSPLAAVGALVVRHFTNSRRLVALRDQIEQYADQGLVYVAALRVDPSDRVAAAGVVEMLAALALYIESAGRKNRRLL